MSPTPVDEAPFRAWEHKIVDASFIKEPEERAKAFAEIGPPPECPPRLRSRLDQLVIAIQSVDNPYRDDYPEVEARKARIAARNAWWRGLFRK